MPLSSSNVKDWLGELEAHLEHPDDGHQSLEETLLRLQKLVEEGDLDSVEKAVQLLGTAVGKQREWQPAYARAGILEFVLDSLSPASTTPALTKQYLRVIGNCVADNDEIRNIVLGKFAVIISCLEHELLVTTTVGVLLNLCNECDDAQVQAASQRLDSTIARMLATNRIDDGAAEYATELITWTTEKLTPTQIEAIASVSTFEDMLDVSLRYDEDNYYDQVAILTHYLQFPDFQRRIATVSILAKVIDLLFDFESRLEPQEIQDVFLGLNTQRDPEKEPVEELPVLLTIQLVNSLSAISASDAFVQNFTLQAPLVRKAIDHLRQGPALPSTVCACVMLGNLATSDEACITMVREFDLHTALIRLLSSKGQPALLYAASGFVRHLAFPEINRTVLAESGLVENCCYLLVDVDPSLRGEAAAILGKLVSNNIRNIKQVVVQPIPEGLSVAQIPDIEVPTNPTILYHVVTQALVPSAPLPSTSMKNAMVEIGRTVIAILRHLGQQSHTDGESAAIAERVYQTPLVARPIAQLLRQRFFTDARSEGLLGLGLMAQTSEGAVRVIEEMRADAGLLEAVKDFLTDGQNEEQPRGERLGRDHQNALVLLYGLAKNGGDALDPSLKNEVDALQAELGKLMM